MLPKILDTVAESLGQTRPRTNSIAAPGGTELTLNEERVFVGER